MRLVVFALHSLFSFRPAAWKLNLCTDGESEVFTSLRLVIFLAILLFSVRCAAGNPNLCTETEAAFFTSTLANGKLVSVCASADVSATSGYLVYRYGTSRGHIEISLPGNPEQFRRFVTTDEFSDNRTGEDDDFVRFRNGAFSYVIYYGIGRKFDVAGLAIFKGDKLLKNIPRVPGTSQGSLAFNGLLDLGIPEEDDAMSQLIFRALLPSSSVVHSRSGNGLKRH